jgi:hypothetical protein
MSYFRRTMTIFVFLLLLYPVFSGKVYAYIDPGTSSGTVRVFYIDPGTASLIIQVLVGALVGALVSVKIFWSRINASIKSFFSRRRHEAEK